MTQIFLYSKSLCGNYKCKSFDEISRMNLKTYWHMQALKKQYWNDIKNSYTQEST